MTELGKPCRCGHSRAEHLPGQDKGHSLAPSACRYKLGWFSRTCLCNQYVKAKK